MLPTVVYSFIKVTLVNTNLAYEWHFNVYLKMYPVSFPCGLLHDIYKRKSYPFMVHPLLPVPRLYRNLGMIPG